MLDGSEKNPRMILMADIGHAHTTMTLFDVVGGAFRFVAQASSRTSLVAPHMNVLAGVRQAIRQLEEMVNRPLLNDEEQLVIPASKYGTGVDYFGYTLSVSEPLKSVLMGLLDEVSLASAQRVLSAFYTIERDKIGLGDERSVQKQIDALRQHKADLILLAGGTDEGADEQVMMLVDMASIGVMQLPLNERAQVVYAGNSALREGVKEALANTVNVHMADNVRPSLRVERLRDAQRVVGELYVATKLNRVAGTAVLNDWAVDEPETTVEALLGVVRAFAHLTEKRVFAVDVGSDTLILAGQESGEAVMQTAVFSDLGVGSSLQFLVRRSSAGNFLRWLPEEMDESALMTHVYNRSMYPYTVPATRTQLHLFEAVVRETIRYGRFRMGQTWEWEQGSPPMFDLLLLRGRALTGLPRPSHAILLALDALEAVGVFQVLLDEQQLLPALGALVAHYPLAAVQILEQGVLTELGWVAVVSGAGEPFETVMSVTMESARIGRETYVIKWGTVRVLPIPIGEEVTLILAPERSFDVGAGMGKKKTLVVHGGEVGLVVDARGRPLPLLAEEDEAVRRQMVMQWLWDMGGV